MLKEFDINEFKFNPFELIGKEWMLIACGDQNAHNMMTASWGGLGYCGKRMSPPFIYGPQDILMSLCKRIIFP